jgi:hypothetical protein
MHVISLVSDIVLLDTGQREMDGKVTIGRKVETSSVVIPIIHEASFPGLDIVCQFLWSISLLICFFLPCVF